MNRYYRPGDMWWRWVLAVMAGAGIALVLASCMTVLTSCAAIPSSVEDQQGIPQVEPYGDCQRIGLVVGVAVANATEYGGRIECPGANIDAWRIGAELYKRGIPYTELLNEKATWANVQFAIAAAAEQLQAGDLFILYLSGHGGQVRDDNGDEADGLDETACLYDGQVRDDKIGRSLSKFRKGVRVEIVTDTCHAATGWRDWAARKVGIRVPAPLVISAPELAHLEVLQVAMCAESESSYGDAIDGGVGTGSWIAAVNGNPDLGRKPCFAMHHAAMPRNQKPVLVMNDTCSDRMLYGRAWE